MTRAVICPSAQPDDCSIGGIGLFCQLPDGKAVEHIAVRQKTGRNAALRRGKALPVFQRFPYGQIRRLLPQTGGHISTSNRPIITGMVTMDSRVVST